MSATANNGEPGPFRCPECGCQCTRGPSGVEYGHANSTWAKTGVRCPRRPECVDSQRGKTSASHGRDENGRFA